MLPDRVSNPGPLTYESGALPTALRGPALTLKTDYIAKLRIELKSILLEIPSNKIKGTYIKLVHL